MLPIGTKIGQNEIKDLEERFAIEHERTYGHSAQNDPIEIVNLRLVACVKSRKGDFDPPSLVSIRGFDTQAEVARNEAISQPKPQSKDYIPDFKQSEEIADKRRKGYFGEEYGQLDVDVITRGSLTGETRHGPLIIEEYDSTIVVPPDWSASLDEWGNVLITRGR